MRPRTLLLLALTALLGAATAAPALATASAVKLEVNQNCVEPNWPCWTAETSGLHPHPAGRITIADGGEVEFVDHDLSTAASVNWSDGSAVPECSGVPTTATLDWEGSCKFEQPGTYRFESATMFEDAYENYKKYEVVVAGTPKATTTPTTPQHQTEATLTGSIEPEGNPTEYHFDYGSSSVTEHSSAPIGLGAADFTNHSVSLPVSGLLPGTEYHFELILSYGASKTVFGGPRTFTTPPAAEPAASTLTPSALGETEATLNGKVDPEGGAEAECFFEWGAGSSGAYEHTTKVVGLQSDGAEHQVSTTVTGLTPGSDYHFRLVARNKLGSVQGNDLTFMAASTPPVKEPSPTLTPTGGNPTATSFSSPSFGQPRAEPASGPLFGSVKLAFTQHGGAVHGSLVVSLAGSEGKLQIELLTKGAAAPVDKLGRSSLHAGKLTFALLLNARGKAALRRHRRLTLTVKITLTPAHGAAVTVTRGIVVHA
jgi:hypothetical protein